MPLHGLLDPTTLLQTFGLLGVAAAVFAETGLLVGFFLPGDSLLFTAGILAAAHKLPLVLLCVVAFVAAVAGDSVGTRSVTGPGPACIASRARWRRTWMP